MTDRLHRPDGLPPRVVVLGGGVAALEAVLALRALAGMRIDLELVAPDPDLRYPPLEVVEPFGIAPPRIALDEALAPRGVRHRRDAASAVDTRERRVLTRDGAVVPYEALVVAIGARPVPTPSGTVAFGPGRGREQFAALLAEATEGRVRHVLFAVPAEVRWTLPLYELAVLTARHLARAGARAVTVAIATPERAPLEVFGGRASGQLLEHLESLGIAFLPRRTLDRVLAGEAVLGPDGAHTPADRVVTIPRLRGPALPGIPHDADGFIAVDRHCAVQGEPDVYAVGDATTAEIKQGGLATQQADAAAETIAARAGANIVPAPYAPVLRGMLLTSDAPRYFESARDRSAPIAGPLPLWWPPTKVAGRHLAPFLAERLGEAPLPPAAADDAGWAAGAIPCEVRVATGRDAAG